MVTGHCPAGAVPAQAKMPERSQVKMRVYNGTKRPGLANTVGAEFKQRGFVVTKMQNAPGNRTYPNIAIIKYGPRALGSAQLVDANFLGEATRQFDIKRKDDTRRRRAWATASSSWPPASRCNQSIAALQEPDLPPGTCAAPES